MDRRRFLETLAAAGLMATLDPMGRVARAATAPAHASPLFVNALARGAWDVTLFCDPKSDGGKLYPANTYAMADCTQVGPFLMAPSSVGAIQFFQRYTQQILLLNGIFAETIDHDTGQQIAMSGSSAQGFPAFGALAAAQLGPTLGLPFVSAGAYDQTASLVAKTLASPNIVTALQKASGAGSYNATDSAIITNAVAARLARVQSAATTPNRRALAGLLQRARQGWESFPGVLQTIADLQANVPVSDGVVAGGPGTDTSTANQMVLGIQLGLAGYVNNATVSLNLGYLNFDQHTDIASQPAILDSFFVGLDYLMRAAAHLNVQDKLVIMAGSDFTRSPHIINPGASPGKDHWAGSTSVMLMGAGIRGNRAVGQTTTGYGDADDTNALQAMPLDATSLAPTSGGVTLLRAHVHAEMRRLAGITGTASDTAYPLSLGSAPVNLLD